MVNVKPFLSGSSSSSSPSSSSSSVQPFYPALVPNSPSIFRDCGPLGTILEGGQLGPPKPVPNDFNLNVVVRTFQALSAFVLPF